MFQDTLQRGRPKPIENIVQSGYEENERTNATTDLPASSSQYRDTAFPPEKREWCTRPRVYVIHVILEEELAEICRIIDDN